METENTEEKDDIEMVDKTEPVKKKDPLPATLQCMSQSMCVCVCFFVFLFFVCVWSGEAGPGHRPRR